MLPVCDLLVLAEDSTTRDPLSGVRITVPQGIDIIAETNSSGFAYFNLSNKLNIHSLYTVVGQLDGQKMFISSQLEMITSRNATVLMINDTLQNQF